MRLGKKRREAIKAVMWHYLVYCKRPSFIEPEQLGSSMILDCIRRVAKDDLKASYEDELLWFIMQGLLYAEGVLPENELEVSLDECLAVHNSTGMPFYLDADHTYNYTWNDMLAGRSPVGGQGVRNNA